MTLVDDRADGLNEFADEPWQAVSWREAAVDYHKNRSAPPHRADPDLKRLRELLNNKVTLSAAWAAMHRNRPTPESTVEAIKQAIRECGLAALKEAATTNRVQQCDATARMALDRWVSLFKKRVSR